MTGAQLKSLLAPAGSIGAGFAIDTSGARDTGTTYSAPSTAAQAAPDCTMLGGTSWTNITGISGVSFAQNDYIDKATSAEVAQEIDVYPGDTATSVLTALGKMASTCPSYKDSQTSSTVKVTEKKTTGLGDGAYTISLSDAAWQNGTTLVAAKVGTAVVTVLASDGSDNGKATAAKVTQHIVDALTTKT